MKNIYGLLRVCNYNNAESCDLEYMFYNKYDSRAYWEKDDMSIDYKEIDKLDVLKFINKECVELTAEGINYLATEFDLLVIEDLLSYKYEVVC